MPTQVLDRPRTVEQSVQSDAAGPVTSASTRVSSIVDALRRRMLWGQLATIAVLGTLHAIFIWPPAGTYPRLVAYLFDLDREMNLPTWFASLQLACIAATLAAIAFASGHRPGRRFRTRWGWACLAVAALYLSADEVALFHERLGTLLEDLVQRHAAAGSPLRSLLRFPSYYWMVVYAPIVIPAGIGAAWFLRRELCGARRAALLGVFVYLYAAVGLDFIEGHYGTPDHTPLIFLLGPHPFSFDIFMVEELLEMLGVTLLLNAFLLHLRGITGRHPAGSDAPAG